MSNLIKGGITFTPYEKEDLQQIIFNLLKAIQNKNQSGV